MNGYISGVAEMIQRETFEHFATVTTRRDLSINAARRIAENIGRYTIAPGSAYFWSAEKFNRDNEQLPGFHIHALLTVPGNRREIWAQLFQRYGRNSVSKIDDIGGTAGYCAKYLTKDLSDFDFKNFNYGT